MKVYIAHNIELNPLEIAEAKALLPNHEFVFIKTTKTIQPAWNPLFGQMQSGFNYPV